MRNKTNLVVEQNVKANITPIIGGGRIMITPSVGEDFWTLRVKVSPVQSIVVFPKFGTYGCGFAKEKDWNTNLPIACQPEEIYDHIKHNRAGAKKEKCLEAIAMLREAAKLAEMFDNEMEARLIKRK